MGLHPRTPSRLGWGGDTPPQTACSSILVPSGFSTRPGTYTPAALRSIITALLYQLYERRLCYRAICLFGHSWLSHPRTCIYFTFARPYVQHVDPKYNFTILALNNSHTHETGMCDVIHRNMK